jgi:hypothetical protein
MGDGSKNGAVVLLSNVRPHGREHRSFQILGVQRWRTVVMADAVDPIRHGAQTVGVTVATTATGPITATGTAVGTAMATGGNGNTVSTGRKSAAGRRFHSSRGLRDASPGEPFHEKLHFVEPCRTSTTTHRSSRNSPKNSSRRATMICITLSENNSGVRPLKEDSRKT